MSWNTTKIGGTEFGMHAVLCTCAEIVCDWEDPTGNGNKNEAREVCGAAEAALAERGLECGHDSYYAAWSGGKYSHWDRLGTVAADCYTRAAGEEGESSPDPWAPCGLEDMPPSWQSAIEEAATAAEAATKRVSREQDLAQLRYARESLAEVAARAAEALEGVDSELADELAATLASLEEAEAAMGGAA